MTEPFEPWAAVLPVVDTFEELGIPYYVGGSLASSYSGVARATQDADLVADLDPRHAGPMMAALQDRYYYFIGHYKSLDTATPSNVEPVGANR